MRGGLGRTLLTAFLLLAIVPLSLIGYVAFSQARSDRQRGTVERLTAAADLQEAQLREWIRARTLILTILAGDLTCSDSGAVLPQVRERWKIILENDTAFRQVFVVAGGDREEWISATTGEAEPRPAWAVSPHELAAPRFWLVSDTPTFELAVPVHRTANQPPRFIVGQAVFTQPAVASFDLGATGVVYLVNREQQILALQGVLRPSPSPQGAGSAPLPQGAARALDGQRGASVYNSATGAPVIGVYRWLDDLQLALVAEQSQAETLAASDELAAGFIGAALGVALLTAIIAAIVTRQITRPIVLLTEAAVRMSEGDLTVRVQSTRRDEIGILASVFNTMAAELYDLYTRLELKVAERTRELQEANEQIRYHAWQLAISAEVGRITTSILDLDTLLEKAAQLIRDAFQLDHVGVYLLDRSGSVAVLRKSVGRSVQPHERQLRLGGTHPVSWAITQRMSRIVAPADQNDAHPDARYKLVLPLALGNKTVGALDLTTRASDGFSESERSVLQMLADQLTVAIENASAYSQEREAANEMREIDRLRGQFLTRMSHQLATYLNTIIGFSQLMLRELDGPLTEAQAQDLSAIRRSGQQLARLLDDILELANLEVGSVELNYTPVDLNSLVSDLHETLASTLVNPQLRLEAQAEPDLPMMMADADRLRQVLSNLVLTAAEMSREGVITLRVARANGLVQFEVGAPAIWDQAENTHGVSLALSRRLVELHGGRLHVAEGPTGSTLFEFALPTNARAAPESENPAWSSRND